MKRVFALLLAFVMLLPSSAVSALAANDGGECVIGVKDASAMPGGTVSVDITVKNNPGIQGAMLLVSWDEGLTLTKKAQNGAAFEALGLTAPAKLSSPYNLVWYAQDLEPEDIKDGVIATLEFKVSPQAKDGDRLTVSVTSEYGDIVDCNKQSLSPRTENGTVSVATYIPGNVNGDGRINALDLIDLSQYIADGCKTDPDSYNVSLNPNAGDVDDSGRLNALDLILISQYIADDCKTDPESYNVRLIPSTHDFGHTHTLQATAYKAATCTADGHIAYWYCEGCGKYFSNSAATAEITFADTKIPAVAHEYVNGSCKHCGAKQTATDYDYKITYNEAAEVLVQDDRDESKYNISGSGKNYLERQIATQAVVNPNERGYHSGEGYYLKDLKCKGLSFKGWYDAAGNHISEIPAGAKRDYELYAHWVADRYTLTYKTYKNLPMPTEKGDVTTESKRFTVFEGVPNLWDPDVKDYVFLGWYQDDGTEATEVPVGTAEDVTLKGYCTSRRNLAVSKQDNNPIILEDRENHVVYFTYEIGEIRNIPLNPDKPFWSIESVAGLSQQVSETYTTTISTTEASSISKVISDMTVSSNTWTLAETWDEVIHNNESCSQTHAEESEDCKSMSATSSNSFSVTDQNGGSSYHKSEDGSTVYDYDSKTETKDKGHQFDASLSGTYANKMSANLGQSTEFGTEASYKTDNAYTAAGKGKTGEWSASGSSSGASSASDKDKYSAGISYENGFEVNAGLSYGYHNNTNTVTKTGSDKVTVNSNVDENTSSWNNSATFSATNQRSMSETVRNTLSDIVTTTKEYGTSYSHGGTDSTTQGFSSTASNTAGTSSTVTYSKLTSRTKTETYSVDGHIEGKYRCILVGTAHVFGVVGYDYNTKSFFTYSFSVMDDKTEEFLDYTPKGGDFTDCENSCLPFEIPVDVFEYVSGKTSKTAGVSYTTNSSNGTAKITGYTGTDTDVVIPAYVSDGKQAYQVTEIASSAFAGKPVRSVVLGEFIKTLPAGAFRNCTELEEVLGSFTEIGDEAFAGCSKLTDMGIPSNVTRIGRDAFRGVSGIEVRAINALCAYGEAVEALGYVKDDILTGKYVLTKSDDARIEARQKEITQEYINSVLNCGAQNIVLDLSCIAGGTPLTLEVPAIASLAIEGGGKTYTDFSIHSSAKETAIHEMTVKTTQGIPLKIDSDTLALKKAFVSGNSTVLVLGKDGATLSLTQDSAVRTTAQYAIIARNPSIESQVSAGGASGIIRVNGSFGYVNSIGGEDFIDITDGEIVKISEPEFEKYQQGFFTVTFDANGGSCGEGSRQVTYAQAIGTLPSASRAGFTFDGWYREDGTKATKDSSFAQDETLRAHWISDWVLASAKPQNTKQVEEKYTYDLREEESSDTSSPRPGWEKFNTRITGYGAKQGPVYSDPSGNGRLVTPEQYVTSYTHHYKYYHRYGWAYNVSSESYGYVWGTDSSFSSGERHTIDLTYALAYKGKAVGEAYYGWYAHDGASYPLWFSDGEYDEPNYATRWYYQDPVYTYDFYRIVAKETQTDPTGQNNVSNVQHWVKYLIK